MTSLIVPYLWLILAPAPKRQTVDSAEERHLNETPNRKELIKKLDTTFTTYNLVGVVASVRKFC